jgi:phage recombination protein Bet
VSLTITPGQDRWTDAQLEALRALGLGRASQGDLALFFHYCQSSGLDPYKRQIYMIERGGKYGIQTSVDGFRLIADRACAARGWARSEEDTIWYDASGKQHTEWLANEPPAAARYTAVLLTPNGPARFSAVARFSEYAAGGPMWKRMPALMLSKVAECLALRRACPEALSGVYSEEEMGQTDLRATPTATPTIAAADAKRQLLEAAGGDKDLAKEVWGELLDGKSVTRTLLDEALAATIERTTTELGEFDLEEVE